jgi:hypothetical protein
MRKRPARRGSKKRRGDACEAAVLVLSKNMPRSLFCDGYVDFYS